MKRGDDIVHNLQDDSPAIDQSLVKSITVIAYSQSGVVKLDLAHFVAYTRILQGRSGDKSGHATRKPP
ncbi:hypothetical protein ACHAXS_005170 [Conticribra weissflogii]